MCNHFGNLTLEGWFRNTGETPLPIRLGGVVLMNIKEAERERQTMHFRETSHYIMPCHGVCESCYSFIEGFFAINKDCIFTRVELTKASRNLKIVVK